MNTYTNNKTLRVCTTFSGYDSQCMALDRIGIPYDLVAWCEIDKWAIKAHDAVYPQYAGRNLGDICNVDWEKVPDFDLFTYSFPCTDISSAGKQLGLSQGAGTYTRLRFRKFTPRECFRLMDVTESDIDRIQAAGISECQQYKMAGNSIVVACLAGIFRNLFFPPENKETLF